MSVFSGMNEASPTGNNPKLEEGEHVVMISLLDIVDGNFGLTFVCETEVVSSDNARMKPGSTRSITIGGLDDKKNNRAALALGRVKQLLAAALGVDPESPIPCAGYTWESLAEYATGESQPLVGRQIKARGWKTQTKAGFDFMNWTFECVPSQA